MQHAQAALAVEVAAARIGVDHRVLAQAGQFAIGGKLVAAIVGRGRRRQHLDRQHRLALDQRVGGVGRAAGDRHARMEPSIRRLDPQPHVADEGAARSAGQELAQRNVDVARDRQVHLAARRQASPTISTCLPTADRSRSSAR
jgi:hypothetical protein